MVTVSVAGLVLGAAVLLGLGVLLGLIIGREKGFNEGADYQASLDPCEDVDPG